MTRPVRHAGPRRALWIAAMLLALPLGGGFGGGAAPTPMATDFFGGGRVVDAGAFGVFGASVEATIWAGSGIAAGPSQVTAGAGGSYNWSFTGVTSAGLANLTLRAWLPWDPNTTVQVVFDLSNGTPTTTYPAVQLSLPFNATESVVNVPVAPTVTLPRGRSANVSLGFENAGNVSVAHDGVITAPSSANFTAAVVGSVPGVMERRPAAAFSYNLSLSAPASAGPENTTLWVTLASLSGANFTFVVAVRIVFNVDAAITAIAANPDPPAEGFTGAVVVTVANRGLDLAAGIDVQLALFNATSPNLYSNSTQLDLAPGTSANLSFAWTPAWSLDPVSAFAAASVTPDFDPADNSLTVAFSVRSTNEPPTTVFSTPADQARVAGSVPVAGSSSDPEGGSLSIDFAVDGAGPFLHVTTPSFAFVWDVSALPDGPHVLSAVATDERGDSSRTSLTVVVLNRGANAPPGLVVDNPLEGDTVRASTTLYGRASDERGELVAVYVSADGGAESAANGTGNWTYLWNASSLGAGPHTLRFRAWDGIDSSADVIRDVTVTLAEPTALRVDGAALEPGSAIPGQSITLSGRVVFDTGAGVGEAAVTATVRGYAALFEGTADGRGVFALPVTAPPAQGNFMVDVLATDAGLSGTASVPLVVSTATLPDIELLPSDFSVSPNPPVPNEAAHHTVSVRNVGAAAANATLRVFENGTLVFEWTGFVQSSRQVPFDRTYTPGVHNLTIRVEDVSPQDGDASNNELLVSIEVPGLPDFEVESVLPSLAAPEAGHNITFLVVVVNVGVADGTAALEVWDGAPLGANSTLIKQEFLALTAGQTERVLATWNATAGVHNIVAKVVLSQPLESNLLNNERNVTITVTQPQETPLPPLLPGFGGLLAAGALGAGAWKSRGRPERPAGRKPKRAAAAALLLLTSAAVAAAVVPAPTGGSLQDAGAVPGPLEGVCQTCHTNPNGGGPLNSFGADYWDERNATNGSVDWRRLGLLDSDGDGTNNADEWNASYLPGDAGSNPGTGVKYGGFTPGGLSGVLTGLLVLLFISIVGAWLGYSSFRRRAARQAAKAADAPKAAGGDDPDAAPKP